jgi:hypothetical protein
MPHALQAKMREAEERRKQEAQLERERRQNAKGNAAANRPKFSFKLA